jgi:hypothetical protein
MPVFWKYRTVNRGISIREERDMMNWLPVDFFWEILFAESVRKSNIKHPGEWGDIYMRLSEIGSGLFPRIPIWESFYYMYL